MLSMLKSFPPLEGNLLSILAALGRVYKAFKRHICVINFDITMKSELRALLPFIL